ncbi:hypothetical protein, partial [Vibrio diabolicus]|uniref:hypothetical protein n=1 Tax=Vibrio diabolicus TaxID=50719 RepID=UPI00211B44F2
TLTSRASPPPPPPPPTMCYTLLTLTTNAIFSSLPSPYIRNIGQQCRTSNENTLFRFFIRRIYLVMERA